MRVLEYHTYFKTIECIFKHVLGQVHINLADLDMSMEYRYRKTKYYSLLTV